VKSPLYLIEKLARWSTASCALALACQSFISKQEKKKKKKEKEKLSPIISTFLITSTRFVIMMKIQISTSGF
jgi:hypothetical protein